MDKELGKILIIDDDEDVLFAAKMLLKKYAQEVIIEKNPKKIPFLLNNDTYDVIMLDMNFSKDITSGKEGFYWLDQILERDPQAVVILITAFGDVEMAVKALKEGATDFVLKPWQNEKLLATLSSAIKLKKSYKEVDQLKTAKKQLEEEINQPFKEIIGESEAIKSVFRLIDKVAETDANILILGENGTGKELISRAVHMKSMRKDNVFVGVDMGAITETLFESELFGHKKGAFTDAKDDRKGRFEIAHKGTLFLDEIGNLGMPLQSKLLTAIQNRQVTPIGSNKIQNIDIRLICATNMPLYEMVEDSSFRQDLLYRINTVEIKLPALRERIEDIPLLAEHFIKVYSKKYRKNGKKISSAALKKLQKYHWPGNIRELQHAIERAVIMSDENSMVPEDFFFLNYKTESDGINLEETFNLDEVERNIIQKAIDRNQGNISRAAKELGLTRASLYRRLEKHGL
ncbi:MULTISPECIES: sigma-54-dependent transcriptional regulator [Reichenbachiella]|uniref:DNA-binding transcriptional response regulator, NtrC family, contains REC, AAA-type ATPase, and a Fis-type DNA-binding domains n=1 Tax=Reichenbachiella agariperforans TaxID=156994 RepID=A0A1M6RKU1_REIAG|nr:MULTISPECIES: sigma-54 dependent transcriptional regulator [Reichenbachiella]MBU2915082.1 sigma-54 dependent transcriptional regulator [Reichenbachiella agariperforans]RJE70508.1 sigma-54-dependent Fis family transcriptional regulator [Reichenbachiella sp. MSK19-1]SHK33049.1 DNA-binding transcriptional response regulator, NtrC family, contains REC, AAA-type ATPase, and a Fis-type DNA-binding domains [Reichenbachiella agariperforans]